MAIKLHAIRTESENIWVDFNGEVPRVGDIIDIGLIADDYDIEERLIKLKWEVYKVSWFLLRWRVEPHPSTNHETTVLSSARVFIRESKTKE